MAENKFLSEDGAMIYEDIGIDEVRVLTTGRNIRITRIDKRMTIPGILSRLFEMPGVFDDFYKKSYRLLSNGEDPEKHKFEIIYERDSSKY